MIDDWHARTPIDGNAAGVLRGGAHFVSKKKIQTADQETPHATKPLPRDVPDLRGRVCGWLTVVGLSADVRKKWVVRCVCGMYTLRTTKAIRNPANSADKCEQCRQVEFLRLVKR